MNPSSFLEGFLYRIEPGKKIKLIVRTNYKLIFWGIVRVFGIKMLVVL